MAVIYTEAERTQLEELLRQIGYPAFWDCYRSDMRHLKSVPFWKITGEEKGLWPLNEGDVRIPTEACNRIDAADKIFVAARTLVNKIVPSLGHKLPIDTVGGILSINPMDTARDVREILGAVIAIKKGVPTVDQAANAGTDGARKANELHDFLTSTDIPIQAIAKRTITAADEKKRAEPNETGAKRNETSVADLFTTDELAKLAGISTKTLRNRLSESRSNGDANKRPPEPAIKGQGQTPDSYAYTTIRPWLLATWPLREIFFPADVAEARQILLNGAG